MELLLHAFDDRPELVDDEIEHQIQRVRRGRLDVVGWTLQAVAYPLVAAAAVVTDGDDVIAADEQVRFAEFQARLPKLRRARGNEDVPFVVFQFGPLVRRNRVFQRQRMQAEFLPQAGDGLAVGGFQFNPDEAVRLPDMVADVVECDRLGLVFGKEQAVDDGLRLRRGMCSDSSSCHPRGFNFGDQCPLSRYDRKQPCLIEVSCQERFPPAR